MRIAELASRGPLSRAAAAAPALPALADLPGTPPDVKQYLDEIAGRAGARAAPGQSDLLSAAAAPLLGAVPDMSGKLDEAAHQAATSPQNDLPEPTEPQTEAGNYQKGHVRYAGLDISIENPKGSTRSGTDPNGKPWQVGMSAHYGYIKRTEGADGEQVDVYLASDREDTPAFVVDQRDPDTREFDEHKVILGAATREEAEAVYDAHFSDGSGPNRGQAITKLSMDQFKSWLKDGKNDEPIAGQRRWPAPGFGRTLPSGPRPPNVQPQLAAPSAPAPDLGENPAATLPPAKPSTRGEPFDPRLRDTNTQAALRYMATQAGWAQRGGELVRDGND